jgi:hypothetical protein
MKEKRRRKKGKSNDENECRRFNSVTIALASESSSVFREMMLAVQISRKQPQIFGGGQG